MITIDLTDAAGKICRLSGNAGATIRDLAVASDVAGLMGECGGAMACGTCHIIIANEWAQRVGAATGDEAIILDGTLSRHAQSRLSCQLTLSQNMNGMQAYVAKA